MSEQGKHTPGPWAVHPFNARVDAFNSDGPVPVCELLWPTDLRSEYETEANARLIAAAPKMLAALHIAKEALCRSDVMSLYIGPQYLEGVSDAIADAEGRA